MRQDRVQCSVVAHWHCPWVCLRAHPRFCVRVSVKTPLSHRVAFLLARCSSQEVSCMPSGGASFSEVRSSKSSFTAPHLIPMSRVTPPHHGRAASHARCAATSVAKRQSHRSPSCSSKLTPECCNQQNLEPPWSLLASRCALAGCGALLAPCRALDGRRRIDRGSKLSCSQSKITSEPPRHEAAAY